jgi:internalin A
VARIKTAKSEKQKILYLARKSISSLPDEIGQLVFLEWLILEDNLLREFPEEIISLSSLRALLLGKNQLTSLSAHMSRLHQLRQLDLSNNKLTLLLPELGRLRKLQALNLSNNGIKLLPETIGELLSLRWLNLQSNKINKIPAEIGDLHNLQFLDLSRNKLLTLPNEITKLTNLEELSLSGNLLKSIPQGLEKLSKLRYLDLRNNPLQLPPEIIRTTNPSVLFRYLSDLKKGLKHSLNETKIVLVGQGSVGKTCLVNRMLHGSFEQNQSKTDGISITQWHLEKYPKDVPLFNKKSKLHNQEPQDHSLRLNIWDFGGQEIMHATHQFFLTKRTLYLLVLDSRLTPEENRVEYWLRIIQSFGGESPVLIVGNKIDQHPLDIDQTSLQKKYPNIVGILETSAASGAGIDELKAAIAEEVDNLPHVRDLLPETWFTVKTKLEGLRSVSNFVTHDKYLEICNENEVSDETSTLGHK